MPLLTPEEENVASELQTILIGRGADSAYDSMPESMGGKILNADIARELSPRYRTPADRIKFTHATYEPARDYVHQRFLKTLRNNKKGGIVMILAGGPASGKTTSTQNQLQSADLIFDSNCAQVAKAKGMIDAALGNGWNPFVVYVHRNFRVAVDSMLCRAIEDGRFIPLFSENGQDMPTLHFNAQRAFIQLHQDYSDKPVGFAAIRNPWTPDNPAEPTGIAIKTLSPEGKRYYTSKEALYDIQGQVVQAFLNADRLPKELIEALGLS